MRLLPILLLALLGACARPDPAPMPATSPAAPAALRPALWAVKDRDTTIYLFGTIHIMKPGAEWFAGPLRQAFDASDELRLEMVLPDRAEAEATATRLGTTTSGPTLPERLPADKRALYASTIAELGLPASFLDRFQPWYAANNLAVVALVKRGFALDSGVERVLTAAATTGGKRITGFETLDQQLGFFAGLSEGTQIAYLTGILDDLPKVEDTVNAMVARWSQGDPEGLARVLNDDLDSNPELTRVLLHDRNARWAEWIAARMAQPGTVFVAVGAGHLAGRDSVQAALAARGIKAKRIDR